MDNILIYFVIIFDFIGKISYLIIIIYLNKLINKNYFFISSWYFHEIDNKKNKKKIILLISIMELRNYSRSRLYDCDE